LFPEINYYYGLEEEKTYFKNRKEYQMVTKTLSIILAIVGLLLAQTEHEIDSLLSSSFKFLNPTQFGSSRFHYECCPITMFPFFALKESEKPYVGEPSDEQCLNSCACLYSRIIDNSGVIHVVLSGMSYYLYGNQTVPVTETYRLFFYMKTGKKWLLEQAPLTVVFELTDKATRTYAPRLKK
jgi:hypothetical protein